MAQETWHVSERSAQRYVKKARRLLTRDGLREDRLFYLKLSEAQRDRYLFAINYKLRELDKLQSAEVVRLGLAGNTIMNSRDKVAGARHGLTRNYLPDWVHKEIQEHELARTAGIAWPPKWKRKKAEERRRAGRRQHPVSRKEQTSQTDE